MKKITYLVLSVAVLTAAINCSTKTSANASKAIVRAMGDSLTKVAQQQLMQQLFEHIESSGLSEAVAYCSMNAVPLLDAVAAKHTVSIQRISERFRNPADQPTATDMPVLRHYAQSLSQADTVVGSKKYYTYYKPIYISMNTCTKCHGTPLTMDTAVLRLIQMRYPNDQAKGYVLHDFRGAWKLQFPKTAY